MTTKFKKSNISVFGEITIGITNDEDKDIPHFISERIDIRLEPLKQSKSGVYCLRNKLNGRLYIGMARNLLNRQQRHWRDLISGEHINKLLLNDYNDYIVEEIARARNPLISGKIANISASGLFEFEVIIYCYPSELTFWEKILIDYLHPYYNVKKKKQFDYDLESIQNKIDKEIDSELSVDDYKEAESYYDNEELIDVEDFQ